MLSLGHDVLDQDVPLGAIDTALATRGHAPRMGESFQGDVLHTIAPSELDDYDLTTDLKELATDGNRYVLVCRRGGRPSWAERIRAFVRRDPIEAVTIIADEEVAAGETISVAVEETDLAGVYRTTTTPRVE